MVPQILSKSLTFQSVYLAFRPNPPSRNRSLSPSSKSLLQKQLFPDGEMSDEGAGSGLLTEPKESSSNDEIRTIRVA